MNLATSKARILVVDDDTILRTLEQRGLAKAGYDTSVAADGGQAQTLLQKESFDLVIVDLLMPGVNGLQLLRWMRDELNLETPVLVFTSHDTDDVIQSARDAGARDVLLKPLRLDKLIETVEAVLGD